MLEVMNLVSNASGRATANQFDICRKVDGVAVERVFQSYKSPCAKLERSGSGRWKKLTFYHDAFYSRTTAKWLRVWLNIWLNPAAVPDVLKAAKEAINGGAESFVWTF